MVPLSLLPNEKFLLPGPACPGYTTVVHATCDLVSGLGLMSVLAVGFLLVTQLKRDGVALMTSPRSEKSG